MKVTFVSVIIRALGTISKKPNSHILFDFDGGKSRLLTLKLAKITPLHHRHFGPICFSPREL